MRELPHAERLAAVNEVRVLASVSHPNITKYYDCFLEREQLYIVMELAQGGDLRSQIAKRLKSRADHFDENLIWTWFIQMCDALKVLHDQNILHRDLKSCNIFLSQDNQIKLGDLGVSKIVESGKLAATIVGTPYYLSPELWQRKQYNTKSDIWALGATLYEMVTLRRPFEGTDLKSLSQNVLRGTYSSIPRSYSADLDRLVRSLLVIDPHARPSVDEILELPAVRDRRYLLSDDETAAARQRDFELMKTIRLHSDINRMKPYLPKSNYSVDNQANKVIGRVGEYRDENADENGVPRTASSSGSGKSGSRMRGGALRDRTNAGAPSRAAGSKRRNASRNNLLAPSSMAGKPASTNASEKRADAKVSVKIPGLRLPRLVKTPPRTSGRAMPSYPTRQHPHTAIGSPRRRDGGYNRGSRADEERPIKSYRPPIVPRFGNRETAKRRVPLSSRY